MPGEKIDPSEYTRAMLEDASTANPSQKLVLARIRNKMAVRSAINQKLRAIQTEVMKLQSEVQQANGALDEMAECLLDLRTELPPSSPQDTLPVIVEPTALPTQA